MGARRERNWRRGGDRTEWTWEMQPEKEGCERRSALVEIHRGGRRCAAGGGDDWIGREKSSHGTNPIRQPCDLYRSMRGEASSGSHGFSAFLYVVCLLCSSGRGPMVVPIQYKLRQTALFSIRFVRSSTSIGSLYFRLPPRIGTGAIWQLASAMDFANCCSLLVLSYHRATSSQTQN
jgi:hypothetical protein